MPSHSHFIQTLESAKGLEAQVHHLISLGGWNDVIHIYLSINLSLPHESGTLAIPDTQVLSQSVS
jgi:hypothetical protein